MTKRNTNSWSLKASVKVAVLALAMVLLYVALDGCGGELPGMVSAAAWHALVLLPSFALTAAQSLQAHTPGHPHFSACVFQMLVFWPLLQSVASAQ